MRRKEEVCGKPTQYNLQTLEYDWKELPDTHFAFQGDNRRKVGLQAPFATDTPYTTQAPPVKQSSSDFQIPKTSFPEVPGYRNDTPEVTMVDYSPYMQWSHEDIRQLLRTNTSEANRSYVGLSPPSF